MPPRRRLEIDHVVPVAEGGATKLANLRLLCRTHNQHEAKRRLGAERIARARELEARERARAEDAARREAGRLAALEQKARDALVLRALGALGFSSDEARLGLALAASLGAASDEARIRHALRELGARRGGTKLELGPGPAA